MSRHRGNLEPFRAGVRTTTAGRIAIVAESPPGLLRAARHEEIRPPESPAPPTPFCPTPPGRRASPGRAGLAGAIDLVRSHALCRCRQRERETLPDGGLLIPATGKDFAYAAGVFASLHATGGSLEAKFDRNEALVLALAVGNEGEQFSVAEVQRWTGWPYQKVRRLLLEYEDRGHRYPGLIDRSPALA